MGVFLPDAGVLARGTVPLGCLLFTAAGEFERVEGVLDVPVGLLSLRTDRGSLDEDGGVGDGGACFGFLVAGLRETGFSGFWDGASLNERP